jgi:accessory gene regulator protein AgrB
VLKQIYTDSLSFVASLIGLVSVVALALVDTPSEPIISSARRKKSKVLSILAFTLITIAIPFFRQSSWVYAKEIQHCLVLSLLRASFDLGKPGHRFMSFVEG